MVGTEETPEEPLRRSSMLAAIPTGVASDRGAEEAIAAGLDAILARRLLDSRLVADLAQVVIALLLVALGLGSVPKLFLGLWLAAVIAAIALSFFVRRHLRDEDPPEIVRTVRHSVLTVGLAWGAGVALIGPDLPFQDLALLMVVVAGIVAMATATLAPDPVTFYSFVGILTGPLTFAILAAGQTRSHLVAICLIAVVTATLIAVFHQSHRGLVDQIRATERLKHSRAEVNRERAFLDGLLASAPMGIVALDLDGKILGVNPRFISMFGFTAADVIGKGIGEVMPSESGEDEYRELMKQLLTRGGLMKEVERRHRDGHLIPVRMIASPVRGATGKASAFVMYDDVSEVKKAQRALREAEARYRHLVESASDLVWEIDLKGRWTFLNAACQEIYGRPPDHMIGRAIWDAVSPEFKERDRAAFARVFAGERITDLETIHHGAGDVPRHLSFSARRVVDETGVVIGARGTARDVSERAAAREAMIRAKEEAERATRAKSAFLATMSHEIRSPMNAIIGMTGLLLESHLTAQQRGNAELVREASEDLLETLNNVLDLSKIEAAQLDLEKVSFDLPALLEKVTRLLAVRATEKNVTIVREVGDGVPRFVLGDPGKLRQVLTNLITNAIKFTDEGSISVVLSATNRGESAPLVRFEVSDTGIGIATDKLETIFEEFKQADSSTTRKYGGTGLGLAIVRGIVRVMGGEITVASELGRGSAFSFEIPMESDTERLEDRSAPDAVTMDLSRVLLIEPEPSDGAMLHDTLSAEGARVSVVGNAAEGISALREALAAEDEFDIAIVDSDLPDANGFSLARRIRQAEDFAGLQLVFLTASGHRGDSATCAEIGIGAYLLKPLMRVDLLEVVGALLRRGRYDPAQVELITRHSIAEARADLNVLVVDDSKVNREIAAAHLTRRGHHVSHAVDGREAVEAVARQRFDVILMDIQMPEMDGREATRAIRASRGTPDIPIIGLSAHAGDEERDRCFEAGMTGYLSKPYSPRDLFALVEGWGIAQSDPTLPGPEYSPAAEIDEFRKQMREVGAEDAVDQLLQVFWQEAPEMMTALEDALAAKDADDVRRCAHKYKSAAGAVGAASLANCLARVEIGGREGDISGLEDPVAGVRGMHRAFASLLAGDRGSQG